MEWADCLTEDVVTVGSLVALKASLIVTWGMLGGLFKLRLFLRSIAILDSTRHIMDGNTVKL